jgi:hypothetical protein
MVSSAASDVYKRQEYILKKNSKPSAGHKFRKLVGHFLDLVSGGEVYREAVAGAREDPHGVQRCTFFFANPQITSPSMMRLKPPSFDAYI